MFRVRFIKFFNQTPFDADSLNTIRPDPLNNKPSQLHIKWKHNIFNITSTNGKNKYGHS